MVALHAFHAVHVFSLLAAALSMNISSVKQEYYTQNAICRQNLCVNPVFPGLNDLSLLEQLVWQCSNHTQVTSYLEFCKGAVNYDPALPSPNSSSKPLEAVVKAQDDAASTMYFYHLSGMGYEAWDHPIPSQSDDKCVQSIWRMVCFTYFPKAQAGCSSGMASPYQRPCAGPCHNYVQACGVECCDESLKCSFQHEVKSTSERGVSMLQTGYVDVLGPSAECTGHYQSAAGRAGAPLGLLLALLGLHWAASAEGSSGGAGHTKVPRGLLMAGILAACSVLLTGCSMDMPYHNTANWRKKQNYLVAYEFVPPGQEPSSAILNSCADPSLPATRQCSGHGYCKEWNSKNLQKEAVSFCMCERDWADPECGTRRQSQTKAFFLSLFGGVFALDYFYLGFPLWGFAKLFTLGGLGFWWLVDVIRTGAGPVYAHEYRLANDLPHWVFVLVTITLFSAAGFLYSLDSYLSFRKGKREMMMKLHEGEEARLSVPTEMVDGPRFRAPSAAGGAQYGGTPRPWSGYGSTTGPLPNAGAPYGRF